MTTSVIYEAYPQVDLDVFAPELELEFPELPTDIALHYVRKAAIEFARRTHVMQRTVQLNLFACVGNYILEPPDCTMLNTILSICGSGNCCGDPVRISARPCRVPFCSSVVWFEEPNIINFSPAPSSNTASEVVISVVPTQDACTLDAVMYNKHSESILYGARSRIFDISRRPWSSKKASDEQRAEFERRIAAAGTDRLMGGQIGPVKMRTRRVL